MKNKDRKITDSEIVCPCEEGVTQDQCEDCQDLERGTLAYWCSLKTAQSPVSTKQSEHGKK
jgi:hypothetical protein